MTAVAKLLPCPFCGSQPKSGWQGVRVPGMEDCGYWGIDCCNAFAHAGSEQDAAAQWNRRATLSPAELGGVVTFDVVREVVKARTRLGFASPEGQEEQAARAIELIRELCEEVVNLNTASWAAEVITVTEPGDKGVRIRWRGGFPQVGDKLYTTPRAAEAVTEEVFAIVRPYLQPEAREKVRAALIATLTPPSAKGENGRE